MFDEFIATFAYKCAFIANQKQARTKPTFYKKRCKNESKYSSLESQVELTGMLSSREQSPIPHSSIKYKAKNAF